MDTTDPTTTPPLGDTEAVVAALESADASEAPDLADEAAALLESELGSTEEPTT
jgi:hypothetical protein